VLRLPKNKIGLWSWIALKYSYNIEVMVKYLTETSLAAVRMRSELVVSTATCHETQRYSNVRLLLEHSFVFAQEVGYKLLSHN
jgi:hypothetical protein